ncbi:MAG: hypothetical protein ABIS50_23290 [Luteolibacter sp.]|uniref:hypothetical protein n=1 Tax=Luteolibacter sp. TaxID=1962973 RepID=UPI0032636ADC
MKTLIASMLIGGLLLATGRATTITVVPIYEPISLHGTDGDEAVSEVGEALQASVMPRPMALTGAFPEVLVDAIRNPHLIPTNNPNYKVQEVNLLVLCNVGISGEMIDGTLTVRLNIAELAIPTEVDLTTRQILNLAIVALRKTLDEYQHHQVSALPVNLLIEGADDAKAGLRDLATKFVIGGDPAAN